MHKVQDEIISRYRPWKKHLMRSKKFEMKSSQDTDQERIIWWDAQSSRWNHLKIQTMEETIDEMHKVLNEIISRYRPWRVCGVPGPAVSVPGRGGCLSSPPPPRIYQTLPYAARFHLPFARSQSAGYSESQSKQHCYSIVHSDHEIIVQRYKKGLRHLRVQIFTKI